MWEMIKDQWDKLLSRLLGLEKFWKVNVGVEKQIPSIVHLIIQMQTLLWIHLVTETSY